MKKFCTKNDGYLLDNHRRAGYHEKHDSLVFVRSKGITPVVGLILLILVTIGLVGIAMIFFQSAADTTTTIIGDDLQNQEVDEEKIANIESAVSGISSVVSIRNIGRITINEDEIIVYLDNVLQACDLFPNIIPPNAISTCTILSNCSGQRVRVTSPGGVDVDVCE